MIAHVRASVSTCTVYIYNYMLFCGSIWFAHSKENHWCLRAGLWYSCCAKLKTDENHWCLRASLAASSCRLWSKIAIDTAFYASGKIRSFLSRSKLRDSLASTCNGWKHNWHALTGKTQGNGELASHLCSISPYQPCIPSTGLLENINLDSQ